MTLRGCRVLVTGASGFIGSHLVRRLVADGAAVHALVRKDRPAWRLADVGPAVTRWEGDVRERDAVLRAVGGARPDVVFHAAGETSARRFDGDWNSVEESLDVNLGGTLHLLAAVQRAAPEVRSVVRLGGLEEYGRGRVPYVETQREQPISPYSASQVAATHLAQMARRTLGLPVVTLRPALVYGPAQAATFLVPSLILACLAGRDFEMTSGEQTRELIHVRDVVDACLAAAEAPAAAGEVVNVGTGEERTVREIAETVLRIAGGPTTLRIGAMPKPAAQIERLVCDPQRARELLGWTAATALEHGLRETVEWYRVRGSTAVT